MIIKEERLKSDIRDVVVGKKRELVISFAEGKVTVDPVAVNYSRLYDELIQ